MYESYWKLIIDLAEKKVFDTEYTTKAFLSARTFFSKNDEKIPQSVKDAVKEAGGLRQYLHDYVKMKIGEFYLQIDKYCMEKTEKLASVMQ